MYILSKLAAKVIVLTTVLAVLGIATVSYAAERTLYPIPEILKSAKPSGEPNEILLSDPDKVVATLLKLVNLLPEKTMASLSAEEQLKLSFVTGDTLDLAKLFRAHKTQTNLVHFRLYHEAKTQSGQTVSEALMVMISAKLASFDNEALYQFDQVLSALNNRAQKQLLHMLMKVKEKALLSEQELIKLAADMADYQVSQLVFSAAQPLINARWQKEYIIEPALLVTTAEGIEHTVTVVRPKNTSKALPAAFQHTIYANEKRHVRTAIYAAMHGYVGIVANSRGKRLSTNKIEPWEHEGRDAHRLIDWISKQAWSDGRVVMYGGSYNGFTQWAAAKHHHKALKAIAPYAAAHPALGLPMENNVFLTANYQWAFHVTNNKTMDNREYADGAHWHRVNQTLFKSGRPFKDIDKIEGRPNPLFQTLLRHPAFDEYYKAMVPFGQDFANITIPVLSVTGYFDGGQISAIHYLTEHYKYNPDADHSLLIGPYDHWTAQTVPDTHVTNYKLDPVAGLKNTEKVVFEWFDHVLNNRPAPELVQDRVNYQLMGDNSWHHVKSYTSLNQLGIDFYLGRPGLQELVTQPPEVLEKHTQLVDLADRKVQHNIDLMNIIQPELPGETGLVFVSKAFEQDMKYAGAPTGHFSISINKRDVDIGFNLYQIQPDGRAFHLAHYRSRASFARDSSKRQLLVPYQKTRIPLVNTRMSARKLSKGSRIALVLDVNKNEQAQVNMGTGMNVSDETIADAKEKLQLNWYTDSKIHLPITAMEKVITTE